MRKKVEMDQELARLFSSLRVPSKRDPRKAAQGRAAFLHQAQTMASTFSAPVSVNHKARHSSWMQVLQAMRIKFKKESFPMFGTLGTIMLIFSLVLGGSGVTVAAAQGSMPDEALYPVKTWSEAVRVQLAVKEQTKLSLALEFANRRAEELMLMMRAGEVPPTAVLARYAGEVDKALKLAAGKSDEEIGPVLTQLREMLQAQEQAFFKLGPQANPENEALLLQTRTMLKDRLQLCEGGLEDPAALREQLRLRDLNGEPPVEPNFGDGYGPGGNEEPGDGSAGPGEGGYGPGDGICDGDCDGDGESYGPGPKEDSGAGEGKGPGDGTCVGECDGNGEPGPVDTGGDNAGPGDTGGDDSGAGDTGGDDSGGDNSGAGETGGDSSGGDGGGNGGGGH